MNVKDLPSDHPLDGRVCGRTIYAADVPSSRALSAAFVLSSEPHARLRRVDTTQARAIPGVQVVLTGADIGPRYLLGRALRDYPVLAVDRVLFVGQRIAAVAACDTETARVAAERVQVEYEPLDSIFDARRAMHGTARALHPHYDSYAGALQARPGANVQGFSEQVEGDTTTAFTGCNETYEHSFAWPRMHVAPIEPHACLVAAGFPEVHVYAAHKEPYKLRRDLALLSGRPEDDFIVHVVNIGGDFGAKGFPFIEVACYFLSVATGRPVRATMSYSEELTSTSSRHAGTIRLRTGLRSGRIHAHEAESQFDGGAYAAIKPVPGAILPITRMPLGLYQVPNRYEQSVTVYTNNLPGGHCRCPGQFQAMFASESHVDIMARARGEDPVEFRLRNTWDPMVKKVLTVLRDIVDDWRKQRESDTGIGISVFSEVAGAGASTVACEATPTGVELSVTVPDQGAGSYETFRLLAARTLQIPREMIRVRAVGTAAALTDAGAGASRVTAVAGRACDNACRALLQELGNPPEAMDGDGRYWLGERLDELGRSSVRVTGTWSVDRSPVDQDTAVDAVPSHGGLAIEVSVDRTSGVVSVRRALIIADTGRIINPVGHRGQLEGGFVFGLSQTLFEELIVEDGQIVSASLGEYKIASAADVPPLDIRILPHDEAEDEGFEAIKPVGELVTRGVPAAVANAIADAVDIRLTVLPITAERVWRALQAS